MKGFSDILKRNTVIWMLVFLSSNIWIVEHVKVGCNRDKIPRGKQGSHRLFTLRAKIVSLGGMCLTPRPYQEISNKGEKKAEGDRKAHRPASSWVQGRWPATKTRGLYFDSKGRPPGHPNIQAAVPGSAGSPKYHSLGHRAKVCSLWELVGGRSTKNISPGPGHPPGLRQHGRSQPDLLWRILAWLPQFRCLPSVGGDLNKQRVINAVYCARAASHEPRSTHPFHSLG
ncbi:hypothetical protein VTI74DRAFT_8135 [Chaetomium olivicolor]